MSRPVCLICLITVNKVLNWQLYICCINGGSVRLIHALSVSECMRWTGFTLRLRTRLIGREISPIKDIRIDFRTCRIYERMAFVTVTPLLLIYRISRRAVFVRWSPRLAGGRARWRMCAPERTENGTREQQSNQKELSPVRHCIARGPASHRVRSIAGDLLRHQIWPLAFCRGRDTYYISARVVGGHFIKLRHTGQTMRRRWRGDTLDVRPRDSIAADLLTYSLTVGWSGRQAM